MLKVTTPKTFVGSVLLHSKIVMEDGGSRYLRKKEGDGEMIQRRFKSQL